MTNPFENEGGRYLVLVDDEGQYSLWLSSLEIPAGWAEALPDRSRGECLEWIEAGWTDMRPKCPAENPPRRGIAMTERESPAPGPPDARDALFPGRFEAQVRRTPNAEAIRFGDTSLSYAELNRKANRLAHYLLARRVRPEDVIGVVMERSPDLVVAILGVLKAGAAYLPLSPDHPTARLASTLGDSGSVGVLADARSGDRLTTAPVAVIAVGGATGRAALADMPDRDPGDADRIAPLLPRHPAYVIYTSGSTGKPKGVVVEHAALAAFIPAVAARVTFAPGDRHFALANVTFDISVVELLIPLVHGATVLLATSDDARDPARLCPLVRAQRPTSLHATPSHWQQILDHDPGCLGAVRIFCGGEALPAALARRLCRTGNPVGNLYGPTETTICATAHEVGEVPEAAGVVPIGGPLPGYRVYLLDAELRTVAAGVPGELYIAGPCLARGYLRRPALTAERFVADPYGPPGSRMYRSGDLGRRREDGAIEFLGRADQQVKVRGHRIEPAEVEAELAELPGVARAAVAVRSDRPGGPYLAAYLVMRPDAPFDADALRAGLAARLPAPMLPSAWVPLERLPLTTNGKIDRLALPAPARPPVGEQAAPQTEDERLLCSLFAGVLGLERVGVEESFFSLGGNSLLAAELAGRIRDAFGVAVPLGTLFEAPSVKALVPRLRANAVESPAFARVLPLRPRGGLTPLFCLPPAGGLSWCYSGLSRSIHSERPIYGLQSPYLAGGLRLPEGMAEIVEGDLKAIRGIQPEGAYNLLGWSFGGYLAHAVACRLQQSGARVGFLGLLNSYQPSEADCPDFGVSETRRALAEMVGIVPGPGEDWDIDAIVEAARRSRHPLGQLERDQARRIFSLLVHHARLMRGVRPGVFVGRIDLFVAAGGSGRVVAPGDWAPHCTEPVRAHPLDCTHDGMTDPAVIAEIGRVVEGFLSPD